MNAGGAVTTSHHDKDWVRNCFIRITFTILLCSIYKDCASLYCVVESRHIVFCLMHINQQLTPIQCIG